jgi:hypothetical protein
MIARFGQQPPSSLEEGSAESKAKKPNVESYEE